jgi:UDP-glucose 4-epimerase
MRIAVTGGAGFIGSHLVKALLERGDEVHVLDNFATGRPEYVHPGAVLHEVDIAGEEARTALAAIGAEVVYHLAAQADVQQSIRNPRLDADVNVRGTINVLDGCRDGQTRKIVFASTSGVYGNPPKLPLREQDPAEPVSFYALSKLTAESYVRLYGTLFGLEHTVLRYGNVYGPLQTAKGEGGVVALFMSRLRQGQPLHVHGDGEQTRDFVFVRDVVEANLAAAEKGAGETIHVSTARRVSVNELVAELRKLHAGEVAVSHGPARPGDIVHSCLDNAAAARLLGWKPRTALRDGLEATYRHWMNV